MSREKTFCTENVSATASFLPSAACAHLHTLIWLLQALLTPAVFRCVWLRYWGTRVIAETINDRKVICDSHRVPSVLYVFLSLSDCGWRREIMQTCRSLIKTEVKTCISCTCNLVFSAAWDRESESFFIPSTAGQRFIAGGESDAKIFVTNYSVSNIHFPSVFCFSSHACCL